MDTFRESLWLYSRS